MVGARGFLSAVAPIKEFVLCFVSSPFFVNHLVLCVNCALLSSLLDSFNSFEIPFMFRCASEKVFLAA